MEEPVDNEDEAIWNSLHPLDMAHILVKIFKFLDIKTLKEVRGVCKLWKIEGGKELLKRSFITLPKSCDTVGLEILEKFLTSTGTLPFLSLRVLATSLFFCGSNDNAADRLCVPINGLLERVGELQYEGQSMHFLTLLLNSLPNLEVLETKCLNLSQNQEWCSTLIKQKNGVGTKTGLENILDKLESLEEIRFNFYLTPSILTDLLPHQHKLGSIQALKFKGSDVQEIFRIYQQYQRQPGLVNPIPSILHQNQQQQQQQYYSNSFCGWRVSRLELNYLDSNNNNNTNPNNVETTRMFLHSLFSDTIKHLRLSVSLTTPSRNFQGGGGGGGAEGNDNDPHVEESVFLPLSLKRLETLEVRFFTKVHSASKPWSLILYPALQLESLKTLTIGGSGPILFDGQLALLKSSSIEKINIYHSSCTPYALANPTITPNLRHLRMMSLNLCDVGARTTLSNVFRDMNRLESLDLYLNFNERLNLDEIFSNQSRSSLKNLKNLKKLRIRSWCRKNFQLSDVSVYNDLIFMDKLQSLDIEGHNFSDKAIGCLRQVLSPHANIRIDNTQRSTLDPFFLSFPGSFF